MLAHRSEHLAKKTTSPAEAPATATVPPASTPVMVTMATLGAAMVSVTVPRVPVAALVPPSTSPSACACLGPCFFFDVLCLVAHDHADTGG